VKPLRVMVFDLDDTLYLERDYVRSGFIAVGEFVRRELGVARFYELAWSEFLRGARGSIFNSTLARLGVAPRPALIERLVELYRHHQPRIRLQADTLDCLARLPRSLKLALITDGHARSQRLKLQALGIAERFSPAIVTSELGPQCQKPHPLAFVTVQQVCGAAGAECLYVADNPAKDFVAPLHLGWRTIRIRRRDGLYAHRPDQAPVTAVIESLADLPDLVQGQPV